MICFIDERAWKAEVENVPAALRSKRIEERGRYLDSIFPSTASGEGWVAINLATMSGLPQLFGFFEAAGICAVDVEAPDVFFLLGGRNLASLTVTRALESGEISLSRIEPDNLMQALTDAAWAAQRQEGSATDASRDIIAATCEDDLVRAGLLSKADVAANDGWLNGDERERAEQRLRDHEATVEEIGRRNIEAFDPWSVE